MRVEALTKDPAGAAILERNLMDLDHGRSDSLGVVKRQALRQQLADHKRHISDRNHHDYESERIAVFGETRHLLKPRCEPGRESLFAHSSRENRDQRNADLHRRQEPVGSACQIEGNLRAMTAFVRKLLKPRFAGRHNRHLSHYKNAIDDDQ
jgi:hypothetical protein